MTLRKALIDLRRKTLSRKPIFHLINGAAIELWMLKVACGLYFSVGSKDGKRISETHTIAMDKVCRAFVQLDCDTRGGLYFVGNTGTRVTVADNVGMTTLTDQVARRFSGNRISLHGLTLDCLFDTARADLDAGQLSNRRKPVQVRSGGGFSVYVQSGTGRQWRFQPGAPVRSASCPVLRAAGGYSVQRP